MRISSCFLCGQLSLGAANLAAASFLLHPVPSYRLRTYRELSLEFCRVYWLVGNRPLLVGAERGGQN